MLSQAAAKAIARAKYAAVSPRKPSRASMNRKKRTGPMSGPPKYHANIGAYRLNFGDNADHSASAAAAVAAAESVP